jgi:hypothetical protein
MARWSFCRGKESIASRIASSLTSTSTSTSAGREAAIVARSLIVGL